MVDASISPATRGDLDSLKLVFGDAPVSFPKPNEKDARRPLEDVLRMKRMFSRLLRSRAFFIRTSITASDSANGTFTN